MLRLCSLAALGLLGLAAPISASARTAMSDADTVRYSLSWSDPASQLFAVRTTVPVERGPVTFSLPAWRPGRYLVQNYASNAQNVRAADETGRRLPVEWVDLDTWRVDPDGAREVTLEYEWYATTFDAGSSTLRPGLAYFNPVNLFPWVEGRIDGPVTLALDVPADWPIATQLERTDAHGRFVAPDYHSFADAPTIASPDIVQWSFVHDDVPYHAVLRPEPPLGEFTRERILQDLEAIAREQTAMFGGAPFEEYWFLYQFVPYPMGHAVEHASSSSYVLHDQVFGSRQGYLGFLGVTAHELFHAWNVKRLRPAAMWPYDYSAPQPSRLHWFTEGVTSYYDNLTLVRAGLMTEEEYFGALEDNIRELQNAPGRLVTSASLASWTAWFSGYGGGNPNQTISFYTKGAVLGLLLDAAIRDATDGRAGFDDVVRGLWTRWYGEGRGMPEDAVEEMVSEVAGRSFSEWFDRYVHGTEELPYESLAALGLDVRPAADPARPAGTIGIVARPRGEAMTITNVLPGSPALAAGIMRDDVVLEIDGDAVTASGWSGVLADLEPGSTVKVKLRRGNAEIERDVAVEGNANLVWRVAPVAAPDARQARLRAGWLTTSAGR